MEARHSPDNLRSDAGRNRDSGYGRALQIPESQARGAAAPGSVQGCSESAHRLQTLACYMSGIVHEINNPSHAAMMSAEMVASVWNGLLPMLDRYHEEKGDFTICGLDYEDLRVEVPRLLQAVVDGAERIRSVAWALKYLIRGGETEGGLFHVADILSAVELLARDALRKRASRFDVHCAPGLPDLQGDGRRLVHVILELLRLAADAPSEPHAGVDLTALCEGVPPEIRIDIRVERTETGPASGGPMDESAAGALGGAAEPGFAIVERIIQGFGGRVSVESVSNACACVCIHLPVETGRPDH